MTTDFKDMEFAFVTPTGRTDVLVKVVKALLRLKQENGAYLWNVDEHLASDVKGIVVDCHGVWQITDISDIYEHEDAGTAFVQYSQLIVELDRGGLLV